MKLFESDNFWKRRDRMRKRAQRPDTPQTKLEDARSKLISDALWVFAAALLVVLGLLGIRTGVVVPDVIVTVFLAVLALYVVISLPGLTAAYRQYQASRKELEKR